jgi:excisionase family DNA binding protein
MTIAAVYNVLRDGTTVAELGSVSARKKTLNGRQHIVDLRNHPEPYVTTSDLAAYWRVSRKQIYKQIEAGTLNAIRLGPRLLRIQTAEAIKFENLAKMAPPEDVHSRPEPPREKSTYEESRHVAVDRTPGKKKRTP